MDFDEYLQVGHALRSAASDRSMHRGSESASLHSTKWASAECRTPHGSHAACRVGRGASERAALQDMTKLICHSTPPGMVIGPVEEVCQGDNLCRVQVRPARLRVGSARTHPTPPVSAGGVRSAVCRAVR